MYAARGLLLGMLRPCQCCSYYEILRFKASVAVAASNETQLTGIQSSDMGQVQAIADNLDANISPHPMD